MARAIKISAKICRKTARKQRLRLFARYIGGTSLWILAAGPATNSAGGKAPSRWFIQSFVLACLPSRIYFWPFQMIREIIFHPAILPARRRSRK